jgi:hypothetical protein
MYRANPEDDVWDHRVGREADGYGPYDEEMEMGAVRGGGGNASNPYTTTAPAPRPSANGDLGAAPIDGHHQMERGRSRTRSPPPPPPRVQVENPFGDNAEPSNINVAAERDLVAKKVRSNISSDRRSVFREAVE